MLNWKGGGPCESRNAGRGSPTGAWMFAVARYSSKLLCSVFVSKSDVITPKLPRNTHLSLKFHATPNLGWKLLKSFLAGHQVRAR